MSRALVLAALLTASCAGGSPADGTLPVEGGVDPGTVLVQPDATSPDASDSGALREAGGAPADAGPDVLATHDAAPPAQGFVTRTGSELMAGGSRLRFVGMNLRGLPHYGSALLPYANPSQIDAELAEVQRMGASAVRVFAAGHDADAATVAARLGVVLDSAAAHGLHVIAALTDFYATGFSPRGDDGFYDTSSGFPTPLLNAAFFAGGYTSNYLPWVRTVVARFAAHPALLAWELGNEIKCDPDHAAFAAFASAVTSTIRGLDPNHLVASGMITAAWMTTAEATALYSDPDLDIITLHAYQGSRAFDDSWLSTALSKPMILEEAGWSSGDRPTEVGGDIAYWVGSRGARGYMQWGFTVVVPDNGNGDTEYGMDHLWHAADYDALFSTYASNAATIH